MLKNKLQYCTSHHMSKNDCISMEQERETEKERLLGGIWTLPLGECLSEKQFNWRFFPQRSTELELFIGKHFFL